MAWLVDANRYTTSNQNTNTDARSFNIQYPTYQVQIDSPLSSQTTKKEQSATSNPNVSAAASLPQGDTASTVKTLGIAAILVYAGMKIIPKVL
jgi:hypothetical protein